MAVTEQAGEPCAPHVFQHPVVDEGPAEWEPHGVTVVVAAEPEPLPVHVHDHLIVDTGHAEFEEVLPNLGGVVLAAPDVEPLSMPVYDHPVIDVPEPTAAKTKPVVKKKRA